MEHSAPTVRIALASEPGAPLEQLQVLETDADELVAMAARSSIEKRYPEAADAGGAGPGVDGGAPSPIGVFDTDLPDDLPDDLPPLPDSQAALPDGLPPLPGANDPAGAADGDPRAAKNNHDPL